MKLPWIVTIWPTCGAKSSDPVNQIVLWCLPSNMYLPFLDLRQPLIILSPLFAALAIEPGCESCCIEGAECSREAGGAFCVPCAIDAALNRRQVTSIGRIFSIICSPGGGNRCGSASLMQLNRYGWFFVLSLKFILSAWNGLSDGIAFRCLSRRLA